MMKSASVSGSDERKTKAQLSAELQALRQRVMELEAAETARQQLDNALQVSELRYRRLFETAQDGILLLDAATGQITDVNPFLEKLLGYSHAEFIGQHLWEIGPFKDVAESKLAFEQLQTNEYIRYEDLPLETRAGQRIQVEFVSNVYRINGDKVIQCNVRDITARYQAEKALHVSEEHYRILMEQASEGIFVADTNGKYVDVNSMGCALLGYTREEILQRSMKDLVNPDELAAVPFKMSDLLAGKIVLNERHMLRKDGSLVPVEISGRQLPDGRLLGMVRDISERKRAEKALQESQEQFRIAQDMSPDGFTILRPVRDAQERIIDFTWIYENAAVARLNGTDPEAVVGQRLLDLFPGHRGTPFLKAYLQVAESGESCIFEADFSDESLPESTSFRIVVVPMAGDIAILAQDLTQRKGAEKALHESEEKYRSLFTNMQEGVALHQMVYDAHRQPSDYLIKEVNPAFEAMLGIAREQAVGQKATVLYGTDQAPYLEAYAEVAAAGQPRRFETHFLPRNQWFDISVTSPKPGGFATIFTDITERKQAEQEIKDLARFPAENPNPVLRVGADGVLLYANKASEAILQEWGCTIGERVPVFWQSVVAEAFAGQASGQLDVQLADRVWSFFITPIVEAGYINLYGRDITESQQAEQALRESEIRLREAQALAHMGFWKWDVKTGEVEWSEEVFKIFGRAPEEFTPQIDSILALSPWPEDQQRDQELITKALATHDPGFYEQKFLRPDQSIGYYSSTFQGIYDEQGDLVSIVGTVQDITERKRLESEQFRLLDIIEKSLNEIYVFDAATLRFEYLNHGALHNLGYSLAEMQRLTPVEIKPAYTEESFRAMVQPLLTRAQDQLVFETRHRRKNGTEYPVEVHLQLITQDAHSVFLAIINDITARQQAEQELRQSQARLQAVLDYSPALISIKDLLGNVVLANRSFAALDAPPLNDLIGKNVFEIFPRAVAEQLWNNDLAALHAQGPVRSEEIVGHKDGRQHTYITVKFPIYLDSDLPAGICAISTDITERKQAEEEVRQRAEEIRTLMEITPVAIWVANDPHCLHITGNQAANQFYEAADDENVSAGVTGVRRFFNAGQELAADELPMQEAARLGQDIRNSELDVLLPSGRWMTIWGNATPLRDAAGAVRGCIGAFMDVTERKRAEDEIRQLNVDLEQRVDKRTAQLKAANQELEAFAYSISHDLRAPLRAMDGFSRILQEEHAPQLDAEAQRYLNIVRENAQQMGRLIDDLLTFSRLNRQPLHKQPVEMNPLVKQVLADLQYAEPARSVELVVGELPPCQADPALLKQVWVNLLSNAFKFTGKREEARIEIGYQIDHGQPVYFVRDNGAGFDMQYADKLFGVFQRFHRAEEYEGTGVGLAIVKRIVDRHEGRVWAEAEVDRGATFYFALGNREG